MDIRGTLTTEVLEEFKKQFYSEEKNILARNVCSRMDPLEASQSSDVLVEVQPAFNYKVEPEGKPITDQKSTGLCWLYSGLNLIRLPFMKQYNLDEFEFSQAHLLFWYKIEECNMFLYNMVKTAKKKEPLEGRLMGCLLRKPSCDGGFWHTVATLVNKYGLMPKQNLPESCNSSYTRKMNNVLSSMLRQYAKAIRDLVAKDGCDVDIDSLIREQMSNIYRVIGICLGIPKDTFTWIYYDKDKEHKTIGPVTPKEFYEKHVKPFFNVDDKVCLVTYPRPNVEYGKLYTVDYFSYILEGKKCFFNNQKVELLLDITAKSIKEGEAVCLVTYPRHNVEYGKLYAVDYFSYILEGKKCFFNNQKVELLLDITAKSIKEGEAVLSSCELLDQLAWRHGMQLKTHDVKLLLGVDIETTLSKSDRLLYGERGQGHAMVFTAIKTDDKDEVTRLKVENSWGEEYGEKGCVTMTAEFFKEFTLEIVVDKKFVPSEVLEVFEQEPEVIPMWYLL